MTIRLAAVVVVLVVVGGFLLAQDLDEAAVARALRAGVADKFDSWVGECRAEATKAERRAATGPIKPTGSYDVTVASNLGAVAFVARQAEDAGRTLSVSEVPTWALRPAVHVFIEPRDPPRDWGAPSSGRIPIVEVPSSIKEIVFAAKNTDKSSSPRPEAFETADVSFTETKWLASYLPKTVGPDGSLMPMTFKDSRARAMFSREAVRGLPTGDLDVVVVTADGERRCTIRARDRAKFSGG
jgi:hypothetical protein